MLDLATRYQEVGEALLPLINPQLDAKYGIEIASFILENVSVPPEVEAAIDKRSSMSAIGNLNDYVKFQMAQGMAQPGGGGGVAGSAAEMAMGFAHGQADGQPARRRPRQRPGGSPRRGGVPPAFPTCSRPADVARTLGVTEADVLATLESGRPQGQEDRLGLARHPGRARRVPEARRLDARLRIAATAAGPASRRPSDAAPVVGRESRRRRSVS